MRAVNLSALIGCPTYFTTQFVLETLRRQQWDLSLGHFVVWPLLGLPVAFIVSWVLVAPFLRVMMMKNISYFRAAFWGLSVGACIALVGVAIDRYLGWRQSVNPNFSSRIGGDGAVRSIDGILTPYGWWVLAQNSILLVFSCVFIAIAVRALIGPGSAAKEIELNK